MSIYELTQNKKQVLDLLLLADEQESMIDRYLDRGTLYVMTEAGETLCVCVVTREPFGAEIKNLATAPDHQRKGHARAMIRHVEQHFCHPGEPLFVGTGDSPLTIPFYEKCGFTRDHVIPNFFIENYDHEIWECGVLLRDMIILKKIAQA